MNSETTDLAKIADKLRGEKPSTAREGDGDLPIDRSATDRSPIDSGPFDIRITIDGTWHYRGSPIERKPLVKLFSSVLMRDDDGQYWLRTPAEKGLIEVEDAPFVVVDMSVETGPGDDQIVLLTTNVDETVTLDGDHPMRVAVNPATGEPRPYVRVRDTLEARVSRAVYYDLAALAVPDEDGSSMGVWSKGTFHVLGSVIGD